jgi:hypothetical protein
MIDEIFDRNYQSGRAELNASLGQLFASVGKGIANSFQVLNRIEYNAPWLERKRSRRHA